jgi:hypothetical protein
MCDHTFGSSVSRTAALRVQELSFVQRVAQSEILSNKIKRVRREFKVNGSTERTAHQ